MNFIVKIALPFVKGFIIDQIKNEAFQKQLVDKIAEKVDFPKVSKVEQKRFTNEVYDATQSLLVEFVTNL